MINRSVCGGISHISEIDAVMMAAEAMEITIITSHNPIDNSYSCLIDATRRDDKIKKEINESLRERGERNGQDSTRSE